MVTIVCYQDVIWTVTTHFLPRSRAVVKFKMMLCKFPTLHWAAVKYYTLTEIQDTVLH